MPKLRRDQNIINGKIIAGEIYSEVQADIASNSASLSESIKSPPCLAVILVGNNPASESYVRAKLRVAQEIGVATRLIRMTENSSEDEVISNIKLLNEDDSVHGILVQLPLPSHIKVINVIQTISPAKDVDGFHPENIGLWMAGEKAFLPCTPAGIMELLRRSRITLSGKHAVVIGRSNIVGKPLSLLLQQADATVTMCHSRTKNLADFTRQADIIISAIGKPHFITREHVSPGTVVIDVGINRVGDTLVGDVKFDEVSPIASAITPVPGGVGPMTIAMLMRNTLQAYVRR